MNIDSTKILNLLQELEDLLSTDTGRTREENFNIILQSRERVSSYFIGKDSLDTDEIFVFGSNPEGIHDGGAAKQAKDNFKAENGIIGLHEQSYALVCTYKSTEMIAPFVDEFVETAAKKPNLKFMVTRVGCGNAGHKDREMAKLFRKALLYPNIYLPQSFLDILWGTEREVDLSKLAPSTYKNINTFSSELETLLASYHSWVKDALVNDYGHIITNNFDRKHVIGDVEIMCAAITNAVKFYLRGLPASAYRVLREGIETILKYIELTVDDLFSDVEVIPDKRLYRLRVESDSWNRRKIDRYGMFHMPFSMREKVSTQRYSIAGFPSLYLSESIFGCWEELGRPNLNACMISAVQNVQPFKVLDLTIPNIEDWKKGIHDGDKKHLQKQICRFPLVIASTMRSDNSATRTFKPEYIIPQLMLQIVKEIAFESNRKLDKDNRLVYGIKYTSVNLNRDQGDSKFDYDNVKYENYAIPVQDINHEYCTKLCKIFQITEPICEEIERSKDTSRFEDKGGKTTYEASVFGQLQNILNGKELYFLEEDGPSKI